MGLWDVGCVRMLERFGQIVLVQYQSLGYVMDFDDGIECVQGNLAKSPINVRSPTHEKCKL